MMNKFALIFLTAAMTLGSGAAMAADSNNGSTNASAEAGAAAGGAKENLPPNNVDNSKINNGSMNTNSAATSGTSSGNMTAEQIHKNTMCKDGKCPDMNKKVDTKKGGGHVKHKTDGTTQ
ncbi:MULTISPECIES: YbgS-like family protein [Pantoea]|uniref:Homeobox protein YbgS n=2 Tax=Pantoea TaxID=53335 RepID=A0A0U3TKA7_9GAMM|nr:MULTISPECIES: YbgS-like family protein [Pantoea]ALV93005.1 homeobox protein YbgS [Pantoea vagans]KHJ65460.1 homeobox protein YbgS [Pantoea rodasii]